MGGSISVLANVCKSPHRQQRSSTCFSTCRPCPLWHAEPYEVPDEAGDSQDAFFKVSVLEEELRVMNPDLGAIQVGAAWDMTSGDVTQAAPCQHKLLGWVWNCGRGVADAALCLSWRGHWYLKPCACTDT